MIRRHCLTFEIILVLLCILHGLCKTHLNQLNCCPWTTWPVRTRLQYCLLSPTLHSMLMVTIINNYSAIRGLKNGNGVWANVLICDGHFNKRNNTLQSGRCRCLDDATRIHKLPFLSWNFSRPPPLNSQASNARLIEDVFFAGQVTAASGPGKRLYGTWEGYSTFLLPLQKIHKSGWKEGSQ